MISIILPSCRHSYFLHFLFFPITLAFILLVLMLSLLPLRHHSPFLSFCPSVISIILLFPHSILHHSSPPALPSILFPVLSLLSPFPPSSFLSFPPQSSPSISRSTFLFCPSSPPSPHAFLFQEHRLRFLLAVRSFSF